MNKLSNHILAIRRGKLDATLIRLHFDQIFSSSFEFITWQGDDGDGAESK
jgi:hypothetical protein